MSYDYRGLPIDTINQLSHSDIMNYAERKGWTRVPGYREDIAILRQKFRGVKEEGELLVPLSRRYSDYAHRIADVIVDLATYEKRSIYDVFLDVADATNGSENDSSFLKVIRRNKPSLNPEA